MIDGNKKCTLQLMLLVSANEEMPSWTLKKKNLMLAVIESADRSENF